MLISTHIYLTGCIAILTKAKNLIHKTKKQSISHFFDYLHLPRWRRWIGEKRSIDSFSFSSETLSLLKLFQYRLKVLCKLSIHNLLPLLTHTHDTKTNHSNSNTNRRRRNKNPINTLTSTPLWWSVLLASLSLTDVSFTNSPICSLVLCLKQLN